MIIMGYEVFGSPLFGQVCMAVGFAYLLAKVLTGRRSERTEESRERVRMPSRDFMPERKQPIRIAGNPYYPARQSGSIEPRFAGSESGSIAGSVVVAILVGILSNFIWEIIKGGF